MSRTARSILLLASALAVVVSFKAFGYPRLRPGPRRPGGDPTAEYQRRCGNGEATPECAALRGLVRFKALAALEKLAAARDQRYVPSALGVLALRDEPHLWVAACRVVAQFPTRPDVKAALLPHLLGPYPAVARAAAFVLRDGRDRATARIAEQWQHGHPSSGGDESPYAEERPVALPAARGFAAYPGAERYTPAEAPDAAAWMTTAPVATVVEHYQRLTGATPVDFQTWMKRARQQEQEALQAGAAVMGKPGKDPDFAEMDRLGKEFQRTKNPALLRQIQEVGKRMAARGEKQRAAIERTMEAKSGGILASYQRRLPSYADETPLKTARFLTAEQRGARVTRMIVVYREDAVDRTIVQLVWEGT